MRRRITDEFTPWIAERLEAFGKVDDESLNEIRKIARMELIDPGEIVPDDHEQVKQWVTSLVNIYSKVR